MKKYTDLAQKIKNTYEAGVTVSEAEKLAAEFLYAMIDVSEELQKIDLDTRMRKTGVKTIKAAVYLEEARKGDKKPTEAMLGALVDSNELVTSEQEAFDIAENSREALQNYYNIFKESHIFYRGIAKGQFSG